MKKLTKREKVIISVGLIVVSGLYLKLRLDTCKVATQYNTIAGKLLSGGTWKATDITDKTFKMVTTACCGGACHK